MDEEMLRIVDKALLEGIVEADCCECGMSIECESGVKTAWCDICQKIVKVKNPLIEMGFV